MTKQLFRRKKSLHSMVNQWMPDDGCLIFFNVKRQRVGGAVSMQKLGGLLEVHKISEEVIDRNSPDTLCDVYVCWREKE